MIRASPMKLLWIYLIVLSWTLMKTTALPNPYPQDDPPPEGEETTPAPEGGDAPTESPADGSSPGDGETTTPAAEGETTADGNSTTGDAGNSTSGENVEKAELTMSPDETTPLNVVTDLYGQPLTLRNVFNFTLPNGAVVEIHTETWKTYYTFPPTKPGCWCVTRGPLSKFKLIGNIHFPKIKVTPPRVVTPPNPDQPTTICPPCICPTCPPPKLRFGDFE